MKIESTDLETTEFVLLSLVDKVVFPHVRLQLKLGELADSLVIVRTAANTVGALCKVTARDTVEGLVRVKIVAVDQNRVRVKPVLDDAIVNESLVRSQVADITARLNELIKLTAKNPNQTMVKFPSSASPAAVTNIVSAALLSTASISVAEAQALLELTDVSLRCKTLAAHLSRSIEAAKIRLEVNESIAKKHSADMRKHLIKRQLAELQQQLKQIDGNDDEEGDDIAVLKKKLASLPLPLEVEKIVQKEYKRLDSIQSHHPEHPGTVAYLETIAALPWTATEASVIDLALARAELEKSHFGMKAVKRRVVEFLAVEKLTSARSHAVLCLYGHPGVGKTSIAESIARAMNRKFVRISLSGVRDESELRGHRKTYIGAMAGLIIQSIVRAGVNNPLILLDEIDKVSSMGNPAGRAGSGGAGSVLLELLDAEQNGAFRDAFLNFGFDLSQCLFVCTCNSLQAVARPLLDRLDIVRVEGYTDEEKIEIAKRHLVQRQMDANGLTGRVKLDFSDHTLRFIISNYTHEAGVRNLSRRIADICRFFALEIADSAADPANVHVGEREVLKILGPAIAEGPVIPATLPTGVALGLAVSGAGGDVLFVESAITGREAAKGSITVTGQLGEVMRESVRTALSLLMARSLNRSNSVAGSVYCKIDPALVRAADIHVHFPTGSVQKDGPSAGVSTSIALASLFSRIKAPSDLASTGEITLRGDVLPIGGVKEKLIAAHRAGLRTVILPHANRAAVNEEDIPSSVLKEINVVFVRNIDEVMRVAFPEICASDAFQVPTKSAL